MRATQPTRSGTVDRAGVGVHYEVYGDGGPTVYLLMPDVIVHSHAWKAQVPFLARHFRVVVSDPPGNGLSGAPARPESSRTACCSTTSGRCWMPSAPSGRCWSGCARGRATR